MPRWYRPVSSLRLLLLVLLAVAVAAEEPYKLFVAPDRSFRLSLPMQTSVRVVESEDGRTVWAAEGGRAAYLFGYATIARAATMPEADLRSGLETFATAYQGKADVRVSKRIPVTVLGHVGLEQVGTAERGAHRCLFLAVGPRIYTFATDGAPETESRRFWASFQTGNLTGTQPQH